MYVSALGAAPAIGVLCKPGEIWTRDGCAPDTRGEYGEMRPRTVNCPPGTQYHGPTDSCRPLECPDGWFLTAAGVCQQRTATPPPAPVELPPADPTCAPGMRLENAGTRNARCVPEPVVTDTGGSSSGGGGGVPWPSFAPSGPTTTTVSVTPQGPGEPEPKGFGLVEVLMAAGLGLLVSRAIRDER